MDSKLGEDWIWHPEWSERPQDSAGAFVHFRKQIRLDSLPSQAVHIQLSADTKYKLYINAQFVCSGPVRGDEHLWFYDEVNIQPYLRQGFNYFAIRVLRLYHATQFATSFPRLPSPGLFVRFPKALHQHYSADGDTYIWEASLDRSTRLPVDMKEDDFLHIYELVHNSHAAFLNWMAAKRLSFPMTHGLSPPWKLSPRMIPAQRQEPAYFKAVHNVHSCLSVNYWEKAIFQSKDHSYPTAIKLPAGTSHRLELEANNHITAFLTFRFRRPETSGSTMKITYSECYEDEPSQIPYLRHKGDRRDSTKQLIGPEDNYAFGGGPCRSQAGELLYDEKMEAQEIFAPFHFRTFRFLTVNIQVSEDSDLTLLEVNMSATSYPLDLLADFRVTTHGLKPDLSYQQIWETSIRTLNNCMHDCYEDCPFYEQLQYAMDTRSSILFTYCVSGDDRLARQAIIQLHNSFQPNLGLTASRAPSHQPQIIPNFSLFWVLAVADHFEYFHDRVFTRQFVSAIDGVLEHFGQRIDSATGIVRAVRASTQWDFVDWTDAWRPMGIPPAVERTGFSTYTNLLYVYTLRKAAALLTGIQRPSLAAEYQARAESVVKAIQRHSFDGEFFTDGLASELDPYQDYSQHIQIWAVLCGAITGEKASRLLEKALTTTDVDINEHSGSRNSKILTPTSTAMSFYTLRALSLVEGKLYNEHFHSFWEPWRSQLALNLSTWEEDSVSQRSDCHAWGCAALYEFTTEVAGIRPGKPGWAAIEFRPRLTLFPEVNIKVPFGGCKESKANSGFAAGVAHVRWKTEKNGDVQCSLVLLVEDSQSTMSSDPPPVSIVLPGGIVAEIDSCLSEVSYLVKAASLL